jgi:hypothetical protein
VVAASAYPATLDPLVGPETGVDVPLLTPLGGESAPAVAFNGAQWLVVWSAPPVGGMYADIQGARVDLAGEVVDVPAIAVTSAPGYETGPRVASNGADFLVAWGAGFTARAARVSAAGVVQDASPGAIDLTGDALTGGAVVRGVASNGSDYLVTWERDDGTTTAIRAGRVSAAGVALDPGGVVLAEEPYTDDRPVRNEMPAVDSDGSGYLVAWLRRDPVMTLVVGRRFASDGALSARLDLSPASDFGPELSTLGGARLAFDGDHHVLAWSALDGAVAHVLAVRVGVSGAVLDAAPFDVARTADSAYLGGLAAGGGGVMAVWSQQVAYNAGDVRAARIEGGAVLDLGSIGVATGPANEREPGVACGGGSCLVAWQRREMDISETETVRAARVDASGHLLDPAGIVLRGTHDAEYWPAVASDGAGYLVAWTEESSVAGRDVRAARVSGAGAMLDPRGITVATDVASLFSGPEVASNGAGYLVTWCAFGGAAGIYASRVGADGAPADGPPVLVAPGAPLDDHAVASNGDGYLVGWVEYVAGDRHVRATRARSSTRPRSRSAPRRGTAGRSPSPRTASTTSPRGTIRAAGLAAAPSTARGSPRPAPCRARAATRWSSPPASGRAPRSPSTGRTTSRRGPTSGAGSPPTSTAAA